MSTPSTSGALEAVDRILDRGGDADDVLRQVVAALQERGGYAWAGIFFVEEASSSSGRRRRAGRVAPDDVAVLAGRTSRRAGSRRRGPDDLAFLERVAVLVSGHCLVGWDTGGEPWES